MAYSDHSGGTARHKRVANEVEQETSFDAAAMNEAEDGSSEHFISTLPATADTVDAEALADMQTYSSLQEKRKKAKRKKAITIAIIGVVAVVFLTVGVLWLIGSMTADPNAVAPTQTAIVERGLFLDEVSASGNLKPVSSVIATPEVEGLVGEVWVSEGDVVTEGQVLYTVVNDELDRVITEAQQSVNEANNGVALAQIALDDAHRAKSLGQESAEAEGAESFDLGQADSAIRQAELALGSAWNALASAQVVYDEAVARAEKRTVTSSINGSVIAVNIEPGQSLISSSGSSENVPVQIADLSQMLVSVEVNEVDILKTKVDQTAKLTFSALQDLELEGTVNRIATVSSGTSADTGAGNMGMGGAGAVTYKVDILIQSPDPRLKPGMTAKASVESQRIEDALMVPVSAITMLSETEGTVFVIDPDNPEDIQERTVEILASNGLTVAVKGNISEGDEVLAGGGGAMGMGELSDGTGTSAASVTKVSVG